MKDLTSTTSSEPKTNDTTPPPEPPKVPDTYTFTAPEGRELDKTTIDRATPIFRELGLDNPSAQKLMDLYNDLGKSWSEGTIKAVNDMREGWRADVAKDPDMSGKLESIKTEIGRAYQHLDPKLVTEFKAAMDLTGAGDHPAFVKGFWKFAQLINEGTHVTGSGPSKEGQSAPGANSRPSLAASMYPSLPH